MDWFDNDTFYLIKISINSNVFESECIGNFLNNKDVSENILPFTKCRNVVAYYHSNSFDATEFIKTRKKLEDKYDMQYFNLKNIITEEHIKASNFICIIRWLLHTNIKYCATIYGNLQLTYPLIVQLIEQELAYNEWKFENDDIRQYNYVLYYSFCDQGIDAEFFHDLDITNVLYLLTFALPPQHSASNKNILHISNLNVNYNRLINF